jgi:hypothetical protein
LIMSGLVQIHAGPSVCVTDIPERPIASPLARHQFAHGESISSLDHQTVTIASETVRQILPLLDGTKTAAQLGELTNMPVSGVRGAGGRRWHADR